MYFSSRSKNAAFKQVLGAVAILNDKNGTTTQDIFFVLDSLHDKKVQRRAVQSALRIGLKKGFLTCSDNRYKIGRKKKRIERRKTSQVHNCVNKRFNHSKSTKSRVPQSCSRLRRRKGHNQLSGNGLEWACSNNRTDFDISSDGTPVSLAGSEPEPIRDNIANFKKSLSSESFKQNSIKPSENGKEECGTKNYKRGKAANEPKEVPVVNRAGTSAGVNTVSKKLPVDLEMSQAKQIRYNLRPRTSFRPLELPSYLKKESRKKSKTINGMDKNLSEPDKKFGSKSDKKGSGSDNNGENNLFL